SQCHPSLAAAGLASSLLALASGHGSDVTMAWAPGSDGRTAGNRRVGAAARTVTGRVAADRRQDTTRTERWRWMPVRAFASGVQQCVYRWRSLDGLASGGLRGRHGRTDVGVGERYRVGLRRAACRNCELQRRQAALVVERRLERDRLGRVAHVLDDL